MWVPVSILCVYMWGEVCIFICVHEGGNVCLLYGCLFVYVYVSGRALDSTSLIISVDPHPTTMPCRWRMPPVRWWFLAPGQDALWLSEVTPSGSPLPFSGWRPRLSLRWFSWGSRVLGGPRMFGAQIFSMPASCLAGWGCCSPHTLLNIYMEEPYEHKRDHTHRCTLKHSHWCKNRCSQTHIVLIYCCFKTYFVILVRCAAQ